MKKILLGALMLASLSVQAQKEFEFNYLPEGQFFMRAPNKCDSVLSEAIALDMPQLVGCELIGIKVEELPKTVHNLTFWASTATDKLLPQPTPDIFNVTGKINSRQGVVYLDQPIIIPDSTIFVGCRYNCLKDGEMDPLNFPVVKLATGTKTRYYSRSDAGDWSKIECELHNTWVSYASGITLVLRETPASFKVGTAQYTLPELYTKTGSTTTGAKADKVSAAMRVDINDLTSGTIAGVRAEGFDPSLTDFKLWVRAMGNDSLPTGDPIVIKDAMLRADGSIFAKFDKSIAVGDSGVFVGYTFANPQKTVKYPLPIQKSDKAAYPANALYTQEDDNPWKQQPAERSPRISLAVEMPENSMILKDFFSEKECIAGKPVTLSFNAQNMGRARAAVIEYEYTLDGTTYTGVRDCYANDYRKFKANRYDIDSGIPAGLSGVLSLDIIPVSPGDHTGTLKVTKINGQDNHFSYLTSDFSIHANEMPEIPANLTRAANYDGGCYTFLGMSGPHFQSSIQFRDPSIVGLKLRGVKVDHLVKRGLGMFNIWTSTHYSKEDVTKTRTYLSGDSIIAIFDDPITIPKQGIFVNYEFDQIVNLKDNVYPVPFAYPVGVVANQGWIKTLNIKWDDYYGWGCPPVTLLLEGEVPANRMELKALNSSTSVMRNQDFAFDFTVINCGATPIDSIGYTYTVAGQTKSNTFVPQVPLDTFMLRTQHIILPFQGLDEAGDHEMTVTIDRINGVENTYKNNQLTFTVNVASFPTTHRPLMEEATGVKCGWCPKGMLAMHLLKQRHPEFIGAAYHRYMGPGNDPMYTPIAESWDNDGSYPSATIDRGKSRDPYYGTGSEPLGIETEYLQAQSILAPANLNIDTRWNDAQDSIFITGKTKFSFIEPETQYKVGYLITVDNISGNGTEWTQENYFQGKKTYDDDPLLKPLVKGEYDLSVFDHVIIGEVGYMGIDGSISEPKQGQEIETPVSFAVPSLDFDFDVDDINVIMMLIDNTGAVRNARVVKAGESTTADPEEAPQTSINELHNQACQVQYYDLMGRQVKNPQHGIFIRRSGNHTTKIAK